ncbi:MAG: Ornithine carbamoyltransferase 1, anabolic [Gammaproteobacteria bacterium]|nr:Ornithine carbamoyltransferase 1, anabolic [Gammaproteobacteria bacterium]
MNTRHFLTLRDFEPAELEALIERSIMLKSEYRQGHRYEPLRNCTLAMIFDKSSTRTRLSFEAAMTHFGGKAVYLSPGTTQLGRGELVEDTARVMSRIVDAVVIRTVSHQMVETFATYSRVPVINGLTDEYHPCQLLADMQTYVEHRGPIRGRHVAWIGDGNNMCNSWINAAWSFGFRLNIATPEEFKPDARIMKRAGGWVSWHKDPAAVAHEADLIATDTWASMGQEAEKERRIRAFKGYGVDRRIMDLAAPDALFMHCLPAYRGYEVSEDVLEGEQSVVWDQAENRLHAQKALLEFLVAAQ